MPLTGTFHQRSSNPVWKRPGRLLDDAVLLNQYHTAVTQLPSLADGLQGRLSALRRHLHMHPEVEGQEVETAKFIVAELEKIPGVENIITGIAGHGVTAVLRGSSPLASGGKVRRVLLRAEMAGFPVPDPKTCAYRSKVEGVSHAGFHDCQITAVLGAAILLSRIRELFNGEALLVFQPSDDVDGVGAARRMVAAGIVGKFVPDVGPLDQQPDAYPAGRVPNPTIDACLSLYVQLQLPSGAIGVKYGDMTASEDDYLILVHGKGGHGSVPHLAINPVYVACSLVVQAQSWLSRNSNPFLPSIFCITTIHGGTKANVIPDQCAIEGTLRTHSKEVRQQTNEQLPEFLRSLAGAYDAEAEVTVRHGYAGGVCDHRLANVITAVGKRLLDDQDDVVQLEFPEMGADDFFEFGLPDQSPSVPSLMFWLGGSNEDMGIADDDTTFDVDERCLRTGALVLAGALLQIWHAGLPGPVSDLGRGSPISSDPSGRGTSPTSLGSAPTLDAPPRRPSLPTSDPPLAGA